MHLDECFYLGYFSNLIGTKGELALKLDVDSPSDYTELSLLLVQIQARSKHPVPFKLAASALQNNGILRCKVEGLNGVEAAKALVGKSTYLPLSRLKTLPEDQFYYHEIIGYQVLDREFGLLGIVNEVYDLDPSHLLVVKTEKEKEILIPIHDQIIEKVEKQHKKIRVNCPDGLVELYL